MKSRLLICLFVSGVVFGIQPIDPVLEVRCQQDQSQLRELEHRLKFQWKKMLSSEDPERAISRFIGYVEGTFKSDAHPEWIEFMNRSYANKDASIDFEFKHVQTRLARRNLVRVVNPPSEILPASVKLPKSYSEEAQFPGMVLSVAVSNKRHFILFRLFNSIDGNLICFDSESGTLLWSTSTRMPSKVLQVESGGPIVGGSKISIVDSSILVTSWSNLHGCRFVSFEEKTGKVTSRINLGISGRANGN